MKLLHVTSTMNPAAGGVCQAIRLLIPELAKLGAHNEVACLDDPASATTPADSFKVHRLGPGKFGWWYSAAALPWLVQNLPHFDVVVVHGLWVYPSFAVWRAGQQLKNLTHSRVPNYYVYPHGMLDPYFQIAKERRLKAIRNYFYWKLVEHRIIRDARAILFTCEEERLLARQPFRPYRPQKELVPGLGTEPPPAFSPTMPAAFASRCAGLGEQPYLLFLSRIHSKKGVDLLIRAYAKLQTSAREKSFPCPALVIAGPGMETAYGAAMRQLAAELCAPGSVWWPGMLTGDGKWGALYGCEALVLPSHQENFGIAVAEALACGKPVLISNKVNIWREIASAQAGLVAEDTEAGTWQLLEQWSETTLEKRRLISAAATECFQSKFSIQKAAESLMAALAV